MKTQATQRPLVSVCMPAFNAEQWIGEAIESALAQTWTDFELVVSDNASTDSTLEIVRSYADPRIRVVESNHNIGHIANHTRVIRRSTGTFIKFLHADDILMPDCIEALLDVARENDRVGLVFSPRELRIYHAAGPEWTRTITRQHERFGRLERCNDGRALFFQMALGEFDDNWIGEPVAVLLKREAIEQCGFFHRHILERPDLELYLRMMLRYDVGFVDKPLCVHRQHEQSWTAGDRRPNLRWLDKLWLLEGLLEDGHLGPTLPMIHHLRQRAMRSALVAQTRRLAKRQFTPELLTYLQFRIQSRKGTAPALHEPLAPVQAQPNLGLT